MVFLKSIKLGGFLSFAPDSPAIELTPLNVLIGPNGCGKTNLIEAIDVLRATPTDLASLIRKGGGAEEFVWKGEPIAEQATIEVTVEKTGKQRPGRAHRLVFPELSYYLRFSANNLSFEVVEESIVGSSNRSSKRTEKDSYYRLKRKGSHFTTVGRGLPASRKFINGKGNDLAPDESIVSQRKDPENYPELTWLAGQLSRIQTFRDWTIGHSAPLRKPQRGDLPIDELLPESGNLALVLNELQHGLEIDRFNQFLSQFLPRYQRFSTRIYGGAVQLYLHETGLKSPVPATRLSDGTIRFMAILALLLSPTPPPLLCVEEPELGLHPDAVIPLADLLVEASSRMQLIVSTHSDSLVSALSEYASSVLICEYRNGTVMERIDPAKLQHWLEEYRLGELWVQGKLGGNP
jgi:predicted ATPase